MKQKVIDQLELANDAFSVKLLRERKPCMYAYLHLEVLPLYTYLAILENSEFENSTFFM